MFAYLDMDCWLECSINKVAIQLTLQLGLDFSVTLGILMDQAWTGMKYLLMTYLITTHNGWILLLVKDDLPPQVLVVPGATFHEWQTNTAFKHVGKKIYIRLENKESQLGQSLGAPVAVFPHFKSSSCYKITLIK
ncbi:hypothetical protein NQ315_005323 [Exocentrus adspersus]|uniref:Uncharacterized protein n=1 Tax=Exocentrus adspersus TaxID=1586481 RepID=A0AAV8W1N3_9CUCU|nr:hypothetical protein NQ315_005323 [Exocentrus adspersus]